MSNLQVLHLFGFLPNMLEWTGNPCVQGCTYCYAKMWKRENEPIEKLINFILKKEREKEGMIPFLLRKRSPITVSNRSDIMCAPGWRERLSAIKALGFPIYLETKLNKDYKDLAQVLDKEKDTIYQTVTGWNNKYEESSLLSAEEKIEAAKWLNEQGLYHELAINPYLPDKTSVADIIRMIEYVKPCAVVMRDYHKPSSGLAKKYYMDEYDGDIVCEGFDKIRSYCREKKINHDIQNFGIGHPAYSECNEQILCNERMFGGNHFVKSGYAAFIQEFIDKYDLDTAFVNLERTLDFFAPQIDYFKDCVIKYNDYNIRTGGSYKKPEKERFGIADFLIMQYDYGWLKDYFSKTDITDVDGHRVFARQKDSWYRRVKGLSYEDYRKNYQRIGNSGVR